MLRQLTKTTGGRKVNNHRNRRLLITALMVFVVVALTACQAGQPTAAPAQPTAAPVQPTVKPAEPTAAPAEPTAAPAEPTAAPAEPTAAPTEAPAAPAEKEVITIFRGGVTIDWDKDPIVLALEEATGVDIKFKTADWAEIPRVRNLALSTGEEIDIYHHMDTSPQWIDDEAIIPVDEYIKQDKHPALYNLINSPIFASMKRDGKTYYIPMMSDGNDWVVLVRQDWMEELGLEMPKTAAEFRALLQAFKDRDPSGQTVGMQVEGGQTIRRSMVPILAMHGVPAYFPYIERVYWAEDGKLVSALTSENVKAALKFMNGLYADGLINTDFPSLSSFPQLSEKYIQAGKAGVSWFPAGGNFPIPDSKLAYIPPMTAEGFEFTRAAGLPTQGWISLGSSVKNPEKAIDLLEYILSRDGRLLMNLGIEGKHWKNLSTDGKFERIPDDWPYNATFFPLHFYMANGTMRGYLPLDKYADLTEAMANRELWEPVNGKTPITDIMNASAEWTGQPMMFQYVEFPELNDTWTAIQDATIAGWTKAITAAPAEFDAAWDAYLAALETAGLEDWNAAYQAYYDENLKQ
jgi:ABC-type glycerol-3-phosphate transport system substrate-binding protein